MGRYALLVGKEFHKVLKASGSFEMSRNIYPKKRITSQKTWTFSNTAVRTLNLISVCKI